MQRAQIESIVLAALEAANLARDPGCQLEVSPRAPVFGPGSPLGSIELVSLLIDIEDALRDAGHAVTLSDERAMSRSRSPFRDVPSIVGLVAGLVEETG